MHVIRRAAYKPMPWKNGGGTSLEIAASGTEGLPFDWRLSLALVERDCAFSAYEGYERCTSLVEGAGFELRAPDGATLSFDRPGQVHHYDGSVPWHCQLHGGASWDCNLIAKRGLGARMASRVVGARPVSVGDGATMACIVTLQGPLEVLTTGGRAQLGRLDVAFLDAGESATVVAGSGGGWLAIASLPPSPGFQNL
jgi:uncharacterized protein